MPVRLSYLALGAAWVVLVAFAVAGRAVLPSKYYIDSDRMGSIAETTDPGRVSKSDALTARAYSLLGIRGPHNGWLAGIVGGSFAIIVLFGIVRGRDISLGAAALLIPWLLFTALYLSMYSKELLTTLLVAMLAAGARYRPVLWLGILAVLAYGAFGRAYWLLMLGIGVGVWFVTSLRAGLLVKAILLLVGLGTLLAAVKLATGIYLTDAREMLSAFRAGDPNSQTLVHNLVPNRTLFHDAFNLIGGWIRFLVPVSLLRHGGAQHFVFCALQIVTTIAVLRRIVGDERRQSTLGSADRQEFNLTVAIGVAVTIVLAAFDADFGSYARHQVSLVPWLIQVFAVARSSPGPNLE